MTFHLSFYNEAVQAGLRARFRALTLRMELYGPNLGMPHTRALGYGLFEIRAKAEEGIGRAFFCTMVGQRIIILHSIIKKTDKTPKRELDIALTRQQEVINHEL
jgi:phage-related protein